MKQESNVGYIVRLTLTLLIICAVVSAALAGVNAITKDKIAAIQVEKTQKAIAAVLEGGYDSEITDFKDDSGLVSKIYKGAGGYAVEVAPAGFGGEITMMVGISTDGKVLGISVISHAETPGLGAVAAANTDKGAAFRDQFQGLFGSITIGGSNGIDALSGATITSKAVVDGVNAALACIANLG